MKYSMLSIAIFDQKNSKTVILWNIIIYKYILWIFRIITPVFSVPSEILLICWFGAQETFIIIITNAENSRAAYYFEMVIHILMNGKFKRTSFI